MKKKHVVMTNYTSVVKEVPTLRKFYLERLEDVSGNSGIGIVAVGVMYPSGFCVMEWTTPIKSMGIYHSIAELEALHSHGGKTVIKWDSEL
jgi:hypothetical protein